MYMYRRLIDEIHDNFKKQGMAWPACGKSMATLANVVVVANA